MKHHGIVKLFGAFTLIVGIIGIGTTVYSLATVNIQLSDLSQDYLQAVRELEEAESEASIVLSQAQEIARRAEDVGTRIESALNQSIAGNTAEVIEVASLFAEDGYNCSLWNGQVLGGDERFQWKLRSVKQANTQSVPLLWELYRGSEVVAIASGHYSVADGKVDDVVYGSFLDKIDWGSTVDGNTSDTGE